MWGFLIKTIVTTFPKASAFPPTVFFTPQWNLVDVAMKLQRIFIEHKIEEHVNTHVLRMTPADFCAAFTDKQPIFRSEMISKNWVLPRLYAKSKPPPWIALVNDLKVNRIPVNIKVKCITELPLDTCSQLTLDEIRTRLPPRPGPRSLFKAALRRLSRFQNAVESFKQPLILENPSRTHLIKPCWTNDEQCVHCHKRLHFSTVPTNLSRKCPAATGIPLDVLDAWHSEFESMIKVITDIISKS